MDKWKQIGIGSNVTNSPSLCSRQLNIMDFLAIWSLWSLGVIVVGEIYIYMSRLYPAALVLSPRRGEVEQILGRIIWCRAWRIGCLNCIHNYSNIIQPRQQEASGRGRFSRASSTGRSHHQQQVSTCSQIPRGLIIPNTNMVGPAFSPHVETRRPRKDWPMRAENRGVRPITGCAGFEKLSVD